MLADPRPRAGTDAFGGTRAVPRPPATSHGAAEVTVRGTEEPDVVVVGASWRSATLADRERLAVAGDRVCDAIAAVLAGDGILGAVVLSTCNRTEVYVHTTEHDAAASAVRTVLAGWAGMDLDELAAVTFEHRGEAAVAHLLGVVSGFGSAVPRDQQIPGQVRRAVAAAREAGAVDRLLGELFQHALASARRVRVASEAGTDGPDLLDLGLARVRQVVGDLHGLDVIVVGAGEMGRLAAHKLHGQRLGSLTIANRGAARRAELAGRSGAAQLDLARLPAALADADLVILSTGAPHPVLEPRSVAAAMAGRADRPLVLLDLAVPRDVARGCRDVAGVTVLELDELRSDGEAVSSWPPAVDAIIRDDVAAFSAHARSVAIEPTLVALRTRVEDIRRAAVHRVAGRLAGLDERERAAVDALTRQLLQTVLHAPTVGLKAAAARGDGAHQAAVLGDLFDLSPPT